MPGQYEDPTKKYDSYTEQELQGQWLHIEQRRKRLEQQYMSTPTTDPSHPQIESEYFRAAREQDTIAKVQARRGMTRGRIAHGLDTPYEKQAAQYKDMYREEEAEKRKIERKRAKAYHKQQERLRREQRHDQ